MDEVAFVRFTRETYSAKVEPLNGITVVIVYSQHAAILANIPPLPYPTKDPSVGLQNLNTRMDEFFELYQEHVADFRKQTAILVIGAAYRDRCPILGHHMKQIGLRLEEMEFPEPYYFCPYEMVAPGDRPNTLSLCSAAVLMNGGLLHPTLDFEVLNEMDCMKK